MVSRPISYSQTCPRLAGPPVVHAHHTDALFLESLDDHYLYVDADVPLLFTETETNNARLFGSQNASPFVKDAFHNAVVHGDALDPGTAVTDGREDARLWWGRCRAHGRRAVGGGSGRCSRGPVAAAQKEDRGCSDGGARDKAEGSSGG